MQKLNGSHGLIIYCLWVHVVQNSAVQFKIHL
jgi:hypothetical protein